MNDAGPALEKVARRILEVEVARGPPGTRGAAAVLSALHAGLRESLAPVVGLAGFDALVTRSIRLTDLPTTQATGSVSTGENSFARVTRWLDREEPETASRYVLQWLTGFMALLAGLIGEALLLRLLQGNWPDALRIRATSSESE